MARIQIPKKIRTEDFSEDERAIADKIGTVYNPFADEVCQALNGGIDFQNLNRQLTDVTIIIDGTGKLVNPPQVKSTLAGRIRGLNVVNSVNLINPAIFPTSAPGVNFTTNGNLLTILNVTGLQNNSQYQLTLELMA